MRNWEDIVKDRLEGYESPLPEGSLAEFRALRAGKAARTAKKTAPWIWGVTVAVAAGLAAILFLRRQPNMPDNSIQITQPAISADRPSMIAQATSPVTTMVKTPVTTPVTMPAKTQAAPKNTTQITTQTPTRQEPLHNEPVEEPADNPADNPADEPSDEPVAMIPATGNTSITISLPEDETASLQTNSWIAPTGGGLLGAGTLAALAGSLAQKGSAAVDPTALMDLRYAKAEYIKYMMDQEGPDTSLDVPIPTRKDTLLGIKHYLPVKMGISARIPINEKLAVTTGIDYSLYTSRFTYSYSGDLTQHAHYLSVPARVDWTIASGKVVGVYIGGGLQGDFCVGAELNGIPLKKDGFSLSLVGCGGIQLNASRRVGFFLEPQLSWLFCDTGNKLATYRSEHPVAFTLATGVRLNLGK